MLSWDASLSSSLMQSFWLSPLLMSTFIQQPTHHELWYFFASQDALWFQIILWEGCSSETPLTRFSGIIRSPSCLHSNFLTESSGFLSPSWRSYSSGSFLGILWHLLPLTLDYFDKSKPEDSTILWYYRKPFLWQSHGTFIQELPRSDLDRFFPGFSISLSTFLRRFCSVFFLGDWISEKLVERR